MNIMLGLFVLVVIWLITRALLVLIRKPLFERHWQTRLNAAAPRDAINLVVLGDSISRGVGASRPENSFVEKIAAYITAKTGCPVHIANLSRSGATASDIVNRQIPQAKLKAATIILVEIGVNDSLRQTLEQFRRDMETIFAALPLEKTVIADIPYPKLRRPYQKVMRELLDTQAINCVYPSKVFIDLIWTVHTVAGDFFHPNDRGYRWWFNVFRPGVDQIISRQGLLKTEKK